MPEPTVSIIIPTYKHRDFVLATLDSVFAQTFTDYEVIVINDGSPDDTAAVLRPLAEAGRIRYIEQANTGQSKARNRGISEARGEFIALLDDDDLWPPDKLEWQVAAMAHHPEAGVIAGLADIMDVNGHHLYWTDFVPEFTFESTLVRCPFTSPGQTLIRASLLREVGGLDPSIWGTDDWDLWLRIAKKSRILSEERSALLYRRHEGNASQDFCRMLDNSCQVLEIHLADVAVESRQKIRKAAYRWLYGYLGGPMIDKIKQSVKAGNYPQAKLYTKCLGKLGCVLFSDSFTLNRFIRHLLPKRISALLPELPSY